MANFINTSSLHPFWELRNLFRKETFTDLEVLQHCIGLSTIKTAPIGNKDMLRARALVDQLAEHTVVVCIDCEHYTLNSDEMTEIGIGIMHTQDALPFAQSGDFGDHGENIMKQAKYHFFRLREKTHLTTTNVTSKGPEGNRFGEVRFVTFAEARKILTDIMVQPITDVKGLEGHNRPIIVLGHSILHDKIHLNGKDLDFNIESLYTVVREIDTQQIARDVGVWCGSKEPIGLRTLVQKLEFQHSDSHTAANDVGRTMMCAVLMGVPQEARVGSNLPVYKVTHNIEQHSRDTFEALGGVRQYCHYCASTSHLGDDCRAIGRLRCEECVSRGLHPLSTFHVTQHCPVVRDEVSEERLAWYAGQPSDWKPKYPFFSRDRLQIYARNVPKTVPATIEEVTARRQWYDKQRGKKDMKPFIWRGRSFQNSPLADVGAPQPQRSAHYARDNRRNDARVSSTKYDLCGFCRTFSPVASRSGSDSDPSGATFAREGYRSWF